jgi:hypothetical protein
MVIYVGGKISKMQTQREKNQVVVGPTIIPGKTSFKITDTNSHDGREHYATYHGIYEIL